MNYSVTCADMALIPDILKYTSPDSIPLSFKYNGRLVRGIPAEFSPRVTMRRIDANIAQYIIEGTDKLGLNIRAEYIEYKDFPVTEWVFFITNRASTDSGIISDVRIEGQLKCPSATLVYGNGDNRRPDGYDFFTCDLKEPKSLTPSTGTSCQDAFPYMTLHGTDREIRIAIGWSAKWRADLSKANDNVIFSCGQDRSHTLLHSGETYRTPRINIMAYTYNGDTFRGINLWRHWYFAHIIPKQNGSPIPPLLCLHNFQADGKPEFTGATEKNQIDALNEYIRRDMKPDVWWIDAGWYPCDYEWVHTGTWKPDNVRFPNGLAPIGKACRENDVQFLLWFEPERVRADIGTELQADHPEWLLAKAEADGSLNHDRLLNLGDPEALEWITDRVDSIIKESGVSIYRQDFNFDPLPIWIQNESEDRIGMLENLHVQGYLKYWDSLLERTPSLIIDSCASGGRRNDLDTMRRAITLHYTDVGYGHHPIKQKQHRKMFEWIPYFRAHNMNWDNAEDGSYENGGRPTDEFAFHCALAPSLTSMYTYDDTEEHFEIGRKMDAIWRRAAEIELSGDYYPITECRCDPHDWYAMQFDDAKTHRGFAQAIRNTLAEDESFLLTLPCIHSGKTYTFTDAETGKGFSLSAEELANGINIALPKRAGVIYFYEYN